MDQIFQWPIAASSIASRIDTLFLLLSGISVFFTVLIVGCLVYFVVKYRRGTKADRSNPPVEGLLLEGAFYAVPILICIGLFGFSTWTYLQVMRAPADSQPIYVVGKQWMWKIQHPQGRWEMNELHVPLGQDIKLIMTSEDVIHNFDVPVFRVKQDVVPGRYTTLWFRPTKLGQYHLFCGQYCGTKHSGMVGTVYVMKPEDYQTWLHEGNAGGTLAMQGEQLFRELGCGGCHGPGSNVRAPSLDGVYGNPVPLQEPNGGTRVIIGDEQYIYDSIVNPEQDIAAGYKPIMPSFKGQLSPEKIRLLIEYIKSLGTANSGRAGGTKEAVPPEAPQSPNAPLAATPEPRPANAPLAGATSDVNVRTSGR
ncbi:MAG: cytochrome c oxidase subunit II [Abditibacteriaceae bacterium]